MNKPETIHSELGASSYSRWGKCPGSVRLCQGIEKKSSVYAEEGTLAHDIAATILLGNGPKGPVADEMAEAIQVYIDHVGSLREQLPSFEAIEQKFSLAKYHYKLFGTADYVAYFSSSKTLHVVDYKHGAGVPVEVAESKQLQYYGLGALHANNFPIKKIILTIVQPRCYHDDGPVRSWEVDPVALMDFAETLIEDAIATEQPDAKLDSGDHCRWCAAQALCPLMSKRALVAAQNAFAPAMAYDPVKLSTTLQMLDQVESWCKSVRSFAYQEAEAGRIPPGFKLVDKRATRKWSPLLSADILSKEFPTVNPKEFTETKLKSPAQVEKMITKKEAVKLTGWIVKESSGKNLVEDNDKNANRLSVAPKATAVFDDIN
jgi:hypothetical protein